MTFQVEIDEIDRDAVKDGILRSPLEMILEIGLANRGNLQLHHSFIEIAQGKPLSIISVSMYLINKSPKGTLS